MRWEDLHNHGIPGISNSDVLTFTEAGTQTLRENILPKKFSGATPRRSSACFSGSNATRTGRTTRVSTAERSSRSSGDG